MKPSPRSNPFIKGRLSAPNVNFQRPEKLGLPRSSQASIKPFNPGPEITDAHGFSFASDTSLPELKSQVTIGSKSQKPIDRVPTTREVDPLEESSLGPVPIIISKYPVTFKDNFYVSPKEQSHTQTDFKPPSADTIGISESNKIYDSKRTLDVRPSEIMDKVDNKSKSGSFRRKKVIVHPKNKKSLLEVPLTLEKMFPKLGDNLPKRRRRSCHCEWCGGLSNLERKLNRNPLLALTPRKKKQRREKDRALKEEEESLRLRSKTIRSRGRLHTQNIFKVKLLHSKTLGPQKIAASLGNIKSYSPVELRSGAIDTDNRSFSSFHDGGKTKDEEKKESKKLDSKENPQNDASFVVEKDEEGQNVSLEEVEKVNTKKGKKKGKKLPKGVKLGIKMKKVFEQDSDKKTLAPSQEQQQSSKLSLKQSSSISWRREFKSETFSIKKSVHHQHYFPEKPLHTENPQTMRPTSPSVEEKLTTNKAAVILDVYSKKHSFPYNAASGRRVSTEPSPQNRQISSSIFSPKIGLPVLLGQKSPRNLSDLAKTGFLKGWNLSIIKNTVMEQKQQGILSSRNPNNRSVQDRQLSPNNLLSSKKSNKPDNGQTKVEKLYRRKYFKSMKQ